MSQLFDSVHAEKGCTRVLTFGTKRIARRNVTMHSPSTETTIARTRVSCTAKMDATVTAIAKRKAYVASPTSLASLSSGMLTFLFCTASTLPMMASTSL